MNRRDLIKNLATICGVAAANSMVSMPALASAKAFGEKQSGKSPTLFSGDNLAILRQICALTIPATDTPGAAEVNCHLFIDHQLSTVYSSEQQQSAINVMSAIDLASEEINKQSFVNADKTSQLALLSMLEASKAPFSETLRSDFKTIKGLIVFGYYTSQIGATKELTYLAVPGGFKGSVPLTAVGSAFSSKAYY
ncbi:conserved exported hypothetical protein [Alteromonas sp. 38]|uniref:gluconate 2-dehydrogenase subunit 3 family protein n=1 Tax=Alteromonas TaxID=226 RepID=UPI0012EF377F|nr:MULTISPECIES: gluconate 2-dehydrogenase subunit 3 family protein [Alteromonas]CAD5287587.1 conserved exported hypothetical protein [Alteromonas sp. 154]VXB29324.1 conserved exported hypothetical protein [Alteromonas sp. 38]